jgi:hypothetical protein
MADVEASTRGSVNNPYQGPPTLPRWHPVNVLRKSFWMGSSIFGLDYFDTYSTIMTSPNVSHEWFKTGLAASIGTFWSLQYCFQPQTVARFGDSSLINHYLSFLSIKDCYS